MSRQLFKHQLEGVEFLTHTKKAILADAMGLGKSFTSIVAADMQLGDKVVVCPASLKENWAREIRAAGIEDTIEIIDGANRYIYYDGESPYTWVIVNYDVLDRYVDELSTCSTGIYDEAHYIKNSRAKRTKAALKLAKQLDVLYLLTGTPILNRPEELYTLLKALDHPLGRSWYSYIMRYCNGTKRKFMKWVTLPDGTRERRLVEFLDTGGASNLDELAIKIAPVYLRRTKDELGDKLPAKIIDTVKVELPKEYREKYATAWATYMDYLMNDPDGVDRQKLVNAEMTKHLIELTKLKQIASQGKVDRIVEDIAGIVEQGEKVLVFTQYTETVNQLRNKLLAKKIKSVQLTGADDMTARQKAVDEIQEGSTPVFIGNMQAAGVGLTLTAANTVLFADMAWTPALNQQAEDRAHRIGQHSQVNVHYYLAEKTVDEDIAELLEVKQKIIDKILAGDPGSSRDVTADLVKKILAENKNTVIH